MPYELRLPGAPRAQFETEKEAVDAAKRALQDDPNSEPEVIDLATGKPASPGASQNWREELKHKIGY